MTSFVYYEVHAVRDLGEDAEICSDAEADFWSAYGVLENGERICIGDFNSRLQADTVVSLITATN